MENIFKTIDKISQYLNTTGAGNQDPITTSYKMVYKSLPEDQRKQYLENAMSAQGLSAAPTFLISPTAAMTVLGTTFLPSVGMHAIREEVENNKNKKEQSKSNLNYLNYTD